MYPFFSVNEKSIIDLPQILPSIHLRQNAHLLDGYFVEFLEALRLWNAIVYHDSIDILHVGDADKLVNCGVVALVAFQRWIRGLPLLVCHAEERDIQNICFTRVDDVHLRSRNGVRN